MRRHAKALVAALTLLVVIGVAQAIADTAPTPTMEPVSSISYTSAHLEGKVNPNGGPSTTTWQFQYSSESPDGPWTPGPEGSFEGTEAEETSPLSVEGDLSGLKPNTTYYTRLVATNAGGQSSVSVPSFTTLEVASPSVTIEPVSSPTSSIAQLVGHVNPNAPEAAPTSAEVEAGFRVWWHFQCSPECPGLEGELEADNAEHEVSAEATGLQPGTRYKVSLIAENAGTSASTGPEEFTTEASGPTINSASFSEVTAGGVTLRATINPGGAATSYRFEYTDQADFEANGFENATKVPAPDASIGSGTNDVAVSQAITGLDYATKYVFRVIATNAVDSAESAPKSFTTFATSGEGPRGQFPGQGFLPDDRAWEMVSPPDKHGGNAIVMPSRVHAAADGDGLAFGSLISFGDSHGTAHEVEYLARRDAAPETNGWASHAVTPQQSTGNVNPSGTSPNSYEGDFSEDLSRAVYRSWRPLTDAPNVTPVANLYLRDDLTTPGPGSYHLLSDSLTPVTQVPPEFASFTSFYFGNTNPVFAASSADFEHVIFESRLGLTADVPMPSDPIELILGGAPFKLYENAGGEVRYVGRVPVSGSSCDDDEGPACEAAPSSQAGLGRAAGNYTDHTISSDGSRIFFQSEGSAYVREDGVRTFQLNASEKDTPDATPQPAEFWDSSRDGSRAFFTTGEQLTEDDTDTAPDLYMYDAAKPEGERLTLVSAGSSGEGEASVVVGASADGHYVYFVANGQLIAGEPPADIAGLYLWHDGDLSYIGSLVDEGEAQLNSPAAGLGAVGAIRTSRVSPDGRHLLFMTQRDNGLKGRGDFTGYEQNGNRELYVYDAEDGKLRCASCNPAGTPASANAWTDYYYDNTFGTAPYGSHLSHALSDDGRYVFFSTEESLLPTDTNGTWDAYVYDNQSKETDLLSSGEDDEPSFFVDASADGKDAFFGTAEQLSRWDTDGSYDIYDARVDGGLPEPKLPPPSCQGDACQPAPKELNDPTPASSTFKGEGNQKPRRGKGRCGKGARKVKARNGKSRCVKAKKHRNKRQANNKRGAGR